jgi:hypothetical protein
MQPKAWIANTCNNVYDCGHVFLEKSVLHLIAALLVVFSGVGLTTPPWKRLLSQDLKKQ